MQEKTATQALPGQYDEVFIYVPSDNEIIRIEEGTGDNLLKVLSRKLNDALSSRLFYAHFDSHRDISHFKSSCFCELFF